MVALLSIMEEIHLQQNKHWTPRLLRSPGTYQYPDAFEFMDPRHEGVSYQPFQKARKIQWYPSTLEKGRVSPDLHKAVPWNVHSQAEYYKGVNIWSELNMDSGSCFHRDSQCRYEDLLPQTLHLSYTLMLISVKKWSGLQQRQRLYSFYSDVKCKRFWEPFALVSFHVWPGRKCWKWTRKHLPWALELPFVCECSWASLGPQDSKSSRWIERKWLYSFHLQRNSALHFRSFNALCSPGRGRNLPPWLTVPRKVSQSLTGHVSHVMSVVNHCLLGSFADGFIWVHFSGLMTG